MPLGAFVVPDEQLINAVVDEILGKSGNLELKLIIIEKTRKL